MGIICHSNRRTVVLGFFNECTVRLTMVVGGKALKESHTSKSVGNANFFQHRSQSTG